MVCSLRAAPVRWALLLISFLSLLLVCFISLSSGQYPVPLRDVWQAIWSYNPDSVTHVIVISTRLSRTLTACSVGAALAVAGVLMQTLTRNPLASPAVFGVNAGAVFTIVLWSQLFMVSATSQLMWLAFAGAAVAGGLVYTLGCLGQDGLSPVRVVLAGAAVSALFMALTQGILVTGREGIDGVLFWLAGSASGRELNEILPVLPCLWGAVIVAIGLAPHLNILLSGDDVATGLGQNTLILKGAVSVLIIGLAGTAVAMAGHIGFIGLIVPHMVRTWSGNDHKWLLAVSALWGAILLVSADVAGRLVMAPEEVPLGVMTALLGTPFFIFLARKGRRFE
ncbi:FecCD family ABC transporter permease [Vibrio quintilis]|uniref:Putative siderophore transport system permease protein YfiZ n=1 Tax=Vibrio quintilis TaxID=1117707 RepID=A0A1M7Z3L9_9VIBR|nr:iron ABC transporter permease [Vibrio quintilis]SHO59266.1 putative siderophore transport system permease protein YfiZ precursor [Vibrio quintilis]